MSERVPLFSDGAGVVIKETGARGRVLAWDPSDGDFLIFVYNQDPTDMVPTWVHHDGLRPDDDPIPWPGDDDIPKGVFCFSESGWVTEIQIFSSLDAMLDAWQGSRDVARDIALRCVADPGEWRDVGGAFMSFQLLDK